MLTKKYKFITLFFLVIFNILILSGCSSVPSSPGSTLPSDESSCISEISIQSSTSSPSQTDPSSGGASSGQIDGVLKISGNYRAVNGCLTPLFSNSETHDTGYIIENARLETREVFSKKIRFETNFNGEIELYFQYMKNRDKDIAMLIDNSDSNYYIAGVGGKPYDLLEYGNSIYLIDAEQGVIKQTLLEDDEYNKTIIDEHLPQMTSRDYQLVWGSNPQPNIAGNKFTYYTNRNMLKDGGYKGEIRLKNLDSGEDHSLGVIGVQCLGWDAADCVYYFNYQSDILSIDTNTGIRKTVLAGADSRTVLLYPFLVYPTPLNDGLSVYNIEDQTTITVQHPLLKAIRGLTADTGKSAVLFANEYFKSGSETSQVPVTNMGVFDIHEKTIRIYEISQSSTLQFFGWVTDDFVSLTFQNSTCIVDRSSFK